MEKWWKAASGGIKNSKYWNNCNKYCFYDAAAAAEINVFYAGAIKKSPAEKNNWVCSFKCSLKELSLIFFAPPSNDSEDGIKCANIRKNNAFHGVVGGDGKKES